MSGQDTTQTTQSTNVQQLPPWVSDAAQQNYGFAQSVANRPLQQYQGQMVADVGPQMQQSWNLAANAGQAGAPEYNASTSAYLNAAGYNPAQVTPQTVAGANLQPYMNPFTQNVINASMPIMQQQLGQQQSGIGGQAAQAGAFGGSRQGIQQGVAQAQGALGMGQMAAGLNQANFQQAQQAATGDITRNMQAQTANQAANQAAIQSQLAAAGGLGTLGQQAQTNQQRQFLEQQAAGSQEQQLAQSQINAQMQKFNQAWGYPSQQLGTLLSSLGMTPYGTAQSGSQQTVTEQPHDWAASALGGLQSLGNLFGGGGPLAGLLPGSDRNLKTDIQRVGMHPSGAPLYSFRYKGDPKSYPKITGPMAEDVMKVAPHAVTPVGVDPSGQPRLGVHMGLLNAMGGRPPMGPPGMGAPPPMGMPPASPTLPGALSAPVPMGQVGALGRSMRLPKAPRGPRIPRPALTGAMGG